MTLKVESSTMAIMMNDDTSVRRPMLGMSSESKKRNAPFKDALIALDWKGESSIKRVSPDWSVMDRGLS